MRESGEWNARDANVHSNAEQSSADSGDLWRARTAAVQTSDKSAGAPAAPSQPAHKMRESGEWNAQSSDFYRKAEQSSGDSGNSHAAQMRGMQDDQADDVFGDWQTDNPNDDDEDARCFGDWNEAPAVTDPDADEDGDDGFDLPAQAAAGEKNEKMLAVSANRLKRPKLGSLSQDNPDDLLYGWQQIVQKLAAPLSTIMSKAHVRQLTRECVAVSLPGAYKDIINAGHLAEILRILSKLLAPGCRFSADFDQAADDTETLAAVAAKREFEAQEKSLEHLKNSPLFKDVCHRFGIRSESIRFTFNQDRTPS